MLAEAYDIGLDLLKYRLYTNKMSLKTALETPFKHVKKVEAINFNNNTYLGLSNLAKAYGMSDTCLRNRLSKGMTLEEAIEKPVKDKGKPKPITYNGEDYPSISALAERFNLKSSTVRQRLRKGFSLEDATSEFGNLYTGNSNEIDFRGIHYKSYKALAEAYSIDRCILMVRLGRGWSLESALTEPVNSISIEYRGKEYHNYIGLAEDYNLPVDTLRYRIKAGWDIERAVSTPVRGRNKK